MDKPIEEKVEVPLEIKTEEVVAEVMEREPKKKCCELSKDVKCVCHCCLRTWSLSLNAMEGCCSVLSTGCLCLSALALDCNKCLEQMDCDGH